MAVRYGAMTEVIEAVVAEIETLWDKNEGGTVTIDIRHLPGKKTRSRISTTRVHEIEHRGSKS
ncbi:MAG: hypothetical protein GXP25_12785 [Planctomycetes bacterium]|nr:hypothetical protein [Planctomycetota bacterium]